MTPDLPGRASSPRGSGPAPTVLNQLVLALASTVAAVGVVDAAISREWDFFAVFALILVLQLLLLAQLNRRRLPVAVRADLVRWLRDRSQVTGEPMTAIADRAIAAHRALFVDEEQPAG